MKNQVPWQVWLSIILIMISIALFGLHYLIFADASFIFTYLLYDLAFLPIQVLLVTVVLSEILRFREKRTLLLKMNMVFGAFFTEVGTLLLQILITFDRQAGELKPFLLLDFNWGEAQFREAHAGMRKHSLKMDSRQGDLAALRNFLMQHKEFLLRLLENPNLLEHQRFTDLMWAVSHLAEELELRPSLDGLPAADYRHLSGDIQRVYAVLIEQWLEYMHHLRNQYPYLYSLAVRINPFQPRASISLTD